MYAKRAEVKNIVFEKYSHTYKAFNRTSYDQKYSENTKSWKF